MLNLILLLALALPAFGDELCFLVVDSQSDKEILKQGGALCEKMVPPCSTFKVPLALAAFETGHLKDDKTLLKWDGVKHPIESWNQDQFASEWMQRSVVWYSQRLTPLIGEKKLTSLLKEWKYGNADLSGSLTEAWLTVPGKSSYRVSPRQQVTFMRALWRGELKASAEAIQKTKSLLPEFSVGKARVWGKTGSGKEQLLGWFVGHSEFQNKVYDFALLLIPAKDPGEYLGPIAREKSFALLKGNKLVD